MGDTQITAMRRKFTKAKRAAKVRANARDGERDEDFEQLWAERTAANPNFPALVEAAKARRAFLRRMVAIREELGKTQTQVAAEMRTSAAVISRLENGGNVNLKTLESYLAILDQRIPW